MGDAKKSTTKKTPQEETPIEAAAETVAAEAAKVEEMVCKADYEQAVAELEKIKAQSKEYFEGWQRERADFMNYKKRIERENAQTYQNAVGAMAKRYLVVLDDLERALKNRPDSGESAAWSCGIDLIFQKLQGILEAEGITRMPAETETFDPARHEAISQEDSPDHESGQVIEVLQQGYLIGDRVLRPAIVRIAR